MHFSLPAHCHAAGFILPNCSCVCCRAANFHPLCRMQTHPHAVPGGTFSLRSSHAFLTARPLLCRRIYFAVQNGNVSSPCAEENSSHRSARAFLTVTPPVLFRYADTLLGCNGRASFHRSDHALPIVCPLSCRRFHFAEKNGDALLGCDERLPAGTQLVRFSPPVCCNVAGVVSPHKMQTHPHAVRENILSAFSM